MKVGNWWEQGGKAASIELKIVFFLPSQTFNLYPSRWYSIHVHIRTRVFLVSERLLHHFVCLSQQRKQSTPLARDDYRPTQNEEAPGN